MLWEKIKFIFWVQVCLGVTYIILTISMPFISEMAFDAANATSAQNFPSFQYGARWTPLFLYIIPAVIDIVLVVWKLRQGEQS